MKIAFFGTGDFSRNILEGILKDNRINVELVVSQPDKPVGRKKELEKTPVKICAEVFGIECWQPEKLKPSDLNTDFYKRLDEAKLDFIVVVAYGKIVPSRVLHIPKYGCINLHGSILPFYRGASPIQAAVKNGDTQTGLTVMYMSEGMDEGDILTIQEVDIDADDTSLNIFAKFESFGPSLLVDTLDKIVKDKIEGIPQDSTQASYCSKIDKQDGKVDFKNQTAQEIYNRFRAYTPWPGIFTLYNGLKLDIVSCYVKEHDIDYDDDFQSGYVVEFEQDGKEEIGVLCKEGALIFTQVKLAGKKTMDILSFVNGNRAFLDASL